MNLDTPAGTWLRGSLTPLAQAVTDAHFERRPDMETRYGDWARAKGLQDNHYHLDYLLQAVRTGHPELFTSYVAWARILLTRLGVRASDLRENLEVIRDCLRERAPAELHLPLLAPLNEILHGFDDLPDELPSFIEPRGAAGGLARRYLDLLLASKRREASALVIEAADAGMPLRDIYLRVFQPVQYEIGRLWQLNQVSVAQEHYCSAATQLVMSQLYPRLFRASSRARERRVIVACVADDLHEIGARIVADLFELDGWDSAYVGANTPTASLAEALERERPDLVALSVTMVAHLPQLEQAIAAVREAAPELPILVGGFPFLQAPGLAEQLGADGSAPDGRAAFELARRLVDGASG